MARYSAAYSGLTVRLKEVHALRLMARQASALPTPSHLARSNALCRSGVVLLSSHLEGFVEDLGEIALDRIHSRSLPKSQLGDAFRYHLSKDLLDQIRDSREPKKIAKKVDTLFNRDGDIWGPGLTFGSALSAERFLYGFSNPTTKKIKAFFRRFGYGTLQDDLARNLKSDYTACSNMVDQVVEQRNRIAHGDPVTTGTPTDLEQMVGLAQKYCRTLDVVVGDWFRSVGCPVR